MMFFAKKAKSYSVDKLPLFLWLHMMYKSSHQVNIINFSSYIFLLSSYYNTKFLAYIGNFSSCQIDDNEFFLEFHSHYIISRCMDRKILEETKRNFVYFLFVYTNRQGYAEYPVQSSALIYSPKIIIFKADKLIFGDFYEFPQNISQIPFLSPRHVGNKSSICSKVYDIFYRRY